MLKIDTDQLQAAHVGYEGQYYDCLSSHDCDWLRAIVSPFCSMTRQAQLQRLHKHIYTPA